MDQTDLEFLDEMVELLNDSIQELTVEERRILAKLDQERIRELRAYWQQELNGDESRELALSMDHWDKMLIFTWNRIERVRQSRAMAGKAIMQRKRIK